MKFASALAGARLGSALFVADLDGDGCRAEVLMAAPGPNASACTCSRTCPPTGCDAAIDVDAQPTTS